MTWGWKNCNLVEGNNFAAAGLSGKLIDMSLSGTCTIPPEIACIVLRATVTTVILAGNMVWNSPLTEWVSVEMLNAVKVQSIPSIQVWRNISQWPVLKSGSRTYNKCHKPTAVV